MQVHQSIAYRLAYETATLELDLIQGAMKKLQQEKIESKMLSQQ